MIFENSDRESVERRFMEKCIPEPNSGCWIWTAYLSNKGYGELMMRHTKRAALAHRVSYQLFCGPIEDGKFVLHSCDNPSCVNPDHLRLGDQSANMVDMYSRKRRKKFALPNDRIRLPHKAILAIRRDKRSSRDVASIYGVSHVTVQKIRKDDRYLGAAQ